MQFLQMARNLKGFNLVLRDYINNDGNVRQIEMENLLSDIPLEQKNSVYILEDKTTLSTDLYVQMNILPSKRCFICTDLFSRVMPGMEVEFKGYFTQDQPRWLITTEKVEDMEEDTLKDVILESYEYIKSNEYDVNLYRLKENMW